MIIWEDHSGYKTEEKVLNKEPKDTMKGTTTVK